MEAAASTGTVQDFVDAGGVRTYYEAEGTGEPLVLLHGGFCPIETFAGLRAALVEDYRVYLPERRAHGRTPDVEGPITYNLMAQDTIAFLEAVGLGSAHLVGWSDGAIVGLLVAMQRPDLARTLVLIGQPVNQDGMPSEVAGILKLESMPTEMLPPMLREMYASMSPDGPEHWDVVVDKMWQMIKREPNMDIDDLKSVSTPALIMIADQDMVAVEHAEAMQSALPDAELTVVPDATHGLPMEKPEVVAERVREFLRPRQGDPRQSR